MKKKAEPIHQWIAIALTLCAILAPAMPADAQGRAPRKTASIEIDALIDGAEIYLDGELIGTSPLDGPIKVVPGQHTIKVTRRGFTEFIETYTVKRGRKPLVIETLLIPIRGILIVHTTPTGARIAVDGQLIGETPFDGEVSEGARLITISAPGHLPFEETLTIIAGEQYTLDLSLDAAPEADPFYATWWFWAGVGTAVLGVTTAAILLTDEPDPPAPEGPPRIALPLLSF